MLVCWYVRGSLWADHSLSYVTLPSQKYWKNLNWGNPLYRACRLRWLVSCWLHLNAWICEPIISLLVGYAEGWVSRGWSLRGSRVSNTNLFSNQDEIVINKEIIDFTQLTDEQLQALIWLAQAQLIERQREHIRESSIEGVRTSGYDSRAKKVSVYRIAWDCEHERTMRTLLAMLMLQRGEVTSNNIC